VGGWTIEKRPHRSSYHQFIAFQTNTRPAACENVELSKIATIQWFPTPGEAGAGSRAAEGLFLRAILAPFYIGDAIADPFKRISPPLKPLRGPWERLLRMTFDGEPDSVTAFHFDCGELILDNPETKFREWSDRKRATPPIVGDWHGSN